MTWPLVMVSEHGSQVIGLWALHITERVSTSTAHGIFARESWQQYGLNILGQGLPWTPLAIVGMYRSILQALRNRAHAGTQAVHPSVANHLLGNRLLWAWSLGPLTLVSVPSCRNAHYAIHAMIPWSVWAALGLSSVGHSLMIRGWSEERLRRLVFGLFGGLATAYGLGFWVVGPWLDHRAPESAFYTAVSRQVPRGQPVALLYDDWDRDPYPTPFGPIPHDLAVRLYYLDRPACWHFDANLLADHEQQHSADRVARPPGAPIFVIARERDLPALGAMGPVNVLSQLGAHAGIVHTCSHKSSHRGKHPSRLRLVVSLCGRPVLQGPKCK